MHCLYFSWQGLSKHHLCSEVCKIYIVGLKPRICFCIFCMVCGFRQLEYIVLMHLLPSPAWQISLQSICQVWLSSYVLLFSFWKTLSNATAMLVKMAHVLQWLLRRQSYLQRIASRPAPVSLSEFQVPLLSSLKMLLTYDNCVCSSCLMYFLHSSFPRSYCKTINCWEL